VKWVNIGTPDSKTVSAALSQAKINAWAKNQVDQLATFTPEAINEMRAYTGSDFSQINREIGAHGQALHSGSTSSLGASNTYIARAMDSALSVAKLGLDMTLRRNMKAKWLEKQLGIDLATSNMSDILGKAYIEHAYSSTTTKMDANMSYSAGDNDSKVALIIRAPASAKAVSVKSISHHSSENEVMLARGATYIIRGFDRTLRMLYVDLIDTSAQPI
jgi:hypothetical protein